MRGVNWHVAPDEVVLVELDEGAAVVAEAAHALYRHGPVTWSVLAAGGEGPGAGALGSGLAGPVQAVELPAAAGVVASPDSV